ncbi:hypothetical protein APZ41_005190 [Roseomonas mucosa]|uniref:HMA domain-containing protein n=1 Tax=Roseomonas mucosa TaxID=207340 RepID=A0A1S8D782_9PROT|nr:heavy-metal-associated domain-containing protein [Roseomonas mucosa]ONH84212.1 hypothetical protein APZ41_005190 [Roseomonas mucosa]
MRFVIQNMSCGGCAKGVTATVKAADPGAQVEVELETRRISITGARADSETLSQALAAKGWKVEPAAS